MYGGFRTPVWFTCMEYMVQPSFGCSVCSFLVVLVFSHLPPAALDLSSSVLAEGRYHMGFCLVKS